MTNTARLDSALGQACLRAHAARVELDRLMAYEDCGSLLLRKQIHAARLNLAAAEQAEAAIRQRLIAVSFGVA